MSKFDNSCSFFQEEMNFNPFQLISNDNEIENEFMSNLWCLSPANVESAQDQSSSLLQDFDDELRQAIAPAMKRSNFEVSELFGFPSLL